MTGISLPTRSIRRVSISRLIVSPVPRSAANAMLINLAPVPFRNASREPLRNRPKVGHSALSMLLSASDVCSADATY